MQGDLTYRVYSPGYSSSVAPTSFRTAPAPQKSGFFVFGLVLGIAVLIGGASYAAQRYLDAQLAKSAAARAAAAAPAVTGSSPFTMAMSRPAVPLVPSAAVSPLTTASPPAPAAPADSAATGGPESAASASAKHRRKLYRRHITSGATPTASSGAQTPEPLPPNPF